jgi:ribose 5-phosphate isomerase RpiB
MYMTSVNADNLRNSASDTLDHLQRAAAPAISEGKHQAGVLLDHSGDLIDSVSGRGSEIAADIGKGIIACTKKNPLTALLLAVGAGALLIGAAKFMQSRR